MILLHGIMQGDTIIFYTLISAQNATNNVDLFISVVIGTVATLLSSD